MQRSIIVRSTTKHFNLKRLSPNSFFHFSRDAFATSGCSVLLRIYTYIKLFEGCFTSSNTHDASGFNSIRSDEGKREFSIFSRYHNLLLSSRLLFGYFVPYELYLAVLHLLLVNFHMFLQMIASGESLWTVKAFVRLNSCNEWEISKKINLFKRGKMSHCRLKS